MEDLILKKSKGIFSLICKVSSLICKACSIGKGIFVIYAFSVGRAIAAPWLQTLAQTFCADQLYYCYQNVIEAMRTANSTFVWRTIGNICSGCFALLKRKTLPFFLNATRYPASCCRTERFLVRHMVRAHRPVQAPDASTS